MKEVTKAKPEEKKEEPEAEKEEAPAENGDAKPEEEVMAALYPLDVCHMKFALFLRMQWSKWTKWWTVLSPIHQEAAAAEEADGKEEEDKAEEDKEAAE